MNSFKFQQTQSPQVRQEFKLISHLEQANLLEIPEGDFHKLINELENSPLFHKLYRKDKIIRYQRFRRTDISSSFYQVKEEILADKSSVDVESLLLNKEHVVRQIQKVGLEKFKRYFLYVEPDTSVEDIARECNLEASEVNNINNLMLSVNIRTFNNIQDRTIDSAWV